MNGALTDQLRTRGAPIVVAPGVEPRVSIRVQHLEAYDTVRVDAPANASVRSIKAAAVTVLEPGASDQDDLVVKHRGIEVLDESRGLADAGIPDRSILSISHRRRRPVR